MKEISDELRTGILEIVDAVSDALFEEDVLPHLPAEHDDQQGWFRQYILDWNLKLVRFAVDVTLRTVD